MKNCKTQIMTFIKVTRETDSDNEEHFSIGSLLCLLYLYSLVLCSANVLPLLRDIKYEENPTNRRFDKHRLGRKYFWCNLVHYPGMNYFLFTNIGFIWMTEAKSNGNQSFSFKRSDQKKSSSSSNTSAVWLFGTWLDTRARKRSSFLNKDEDLIFQLWLLMDHQYVLCPCLCQCAEENNWFRVLLVL